MASSGFLWILCKFHIITSTPLTTPSLWMALCPSNLPPKENEQQEINKAKHRKHLTVEAVVCQCVPQCTLLTTYLFLQMFLALSRWSGARPLASATLSMLDLPQGSSQLSFCCLCHGDLESLDQTHLFHTLQQFINEVDFGGGPTQSPRSRPGLVKSSRVGQSVTSPTPIPLGEFSQIAPASSHSATAG